MRKIFTILLLLGCNIAFGQSLTFSEFKTLPTKNYKQVQSFLKSKGFELVSVDNALSPAIFLDFKKNNTSEKINVRNNDFNTPNSYSSVIYSFNSISTFSDFIENLIELPSYQIREGIAGKGHKTLINGTWYFTQCREFPKYSPKYEAVIHTLN